MALPNQRPYIFGHYYSQPAPYSFQGMPGFYSVPAGHSWPMMTDKDGQIWVSPNPLTKNADGTVSGSPLYAADLNLDGTLVFQSEFTTRQLGYDCPPPGVFPPVS